MISMSKDDKLKDKIVNHIYKDFPDAHSVNQIVRAVLVLVDNARKTQEEYNQAALASKPAQTCEGCKADEMDCIRCTRNEHVKDYYEPKEAEG